MVDVGAAGLGPHRNVVGTAVVDLELLVEVFKGKEGVAAVKALLVFAVAALYLAVMSGRVGPDQLMADAKMSCGSLKQSWQVFL